MRQVLIYHFEKVDLVFLDLSHHGYLLVVGVVENGWWLLARSARVRDEVIVHVAAKCVESFEALVDQRGHRVAECVLDVFAVRAVELAQLSLRQLPSRFTLF